MTQLLQQASSAPILGAAFEHLAHAGGMWSRTVPMNRLRERPATHLLQLAQDLASGRYSPDPARQFTIAKADGKNRLLTIYTVRDRVAQRAILQIVQPRGERLFMDCSYGFRPGLTVEMAYNRVREWIRAGYHWLVDADIVACFDRIARDKALRLLRAIAPDDALLQLVQHWLNAVPSPADAPHCGLPQGMGLSPFLCNLYLHGFDLAMRREGVPMVRYADDFVLLARDQRAAQQAQALACERLSSAGLQLHPTKTRVIKSARRHLFLGRRLPELRVCPQGALT